MQRRISALALALAATLAACSDNPSPTSTGPLGLAGVNATMSVDGCVDPTLTFAQVDADVSALITNLFEGTHEQSTFTMWDNLKRDKLESRPLLNHVNNLTKWTLEKLAEGALVDPDGTGLLNTTTGSVRLLDLVFRCSGETPTEVPEVPAGFNAAFALVDASDDDQQFNTSEGDAGAFLPGGSLADNTLLVIVEQPAEVQVNTPFPKLSPTLDVALAGGKLQPNQRLTVLFCPFADDLPTEVYARGVIAHQRTAVEPGAPIGAGVEYLDPPQGGQLDCPHDETASNWRMEKGFFKRNAMHLASLASKALSLVGPRTLYAGHAALGGSLGGFSPMVAVDPYLETEIVITPIAQPLTFGDVTNVTARLRIADVPANPAVYRGQWVNPDAVTTAVNNLGISAHIDAGAPVATTIDNTSFANWSFPCVDAGSHVATVDFPQAIIPANAPVYGASTANASFVVNPRDLTVTAANASRVYGDPNSLTGTLVGVQTDCDPAANITAVYNTTATPTSPVGAYPITAAVEFNEAGGLVSAANYNVISVGGTLTVTPRTLLGTIDDKSKEQGDVNPAFTGSVTNTVAGDGFVVTYASTATTGSPIGTYPITLDLSVAGGGNYLWGGTNGVLTVTDPGGVLFGVESGSDGLSMIDATTGAATFVGRVDPDVTKYTTPVAMSTDPTTGFLYAWNNSDGNTNETQVLTGVLLRLNPCNGLATQISVANSGVVAGALAVSPSGTIYLLAGSLYEVNKTTGALTTIGTLTAGSGGADFDASGTLYSVSLDGTTLYTINTATGAGTVVANLSQDMGTIGSIVFSPSGQLIGSAFGGTQGSVLFDIDKATGAVSNIRSITGGSAPQGMGYAVACG